MWPKSGLEDLAILDFNRHSSPTMFTSESLRSPVSKLLSNTSGPPVSECLGAWAGIVETYTQCQLTKEADKLIAISAIAREMNPIMGCRYLAELWERNLVDQLEWRIERGDRSRPATYRAPSWSWASVEGYCSPNDSSEPMKHLIEIHSAHIDLAADDEMGQVKGGYLDVIGQLFVVDWSLRRSDETFHHYPEFSVRSETWPDCSLEKINEPLHLLPLTVSASD